MFLVCNDMLKRTSTDREKNCDGRSNRVNCPAIPLAGSCANVRVILHIFEDRFNGFRINDGVRIKEENEFSLRAAITDVVSGRKAEISIALDSGDLGAAVRGRRCREILFPQSLCLGMSQTVKKLFLDVIAKNDDGQGLHICSPVFGQWVPRKSWCLPKCLALLAIWVYIFCFVKSLQIY